MDKNWLFNLLLISGTLLAVISLSYGFYCFAGPGTTASDRRLTELCPTEYRFEPKKDITAFDLARIMAQVSGPWIPRHICVSPSHPIPKDLMRQFKQVTP